MSAVMPVYGFVAGDTMGVVVLVRPDETFRDLAARLIEASGVRVAAAGDGRVSYKGRFPDARATLRAEGLGALERVDLVWG